MNCLLVSHNKPNYLSLAIKSVLEQTYKDWNLFIMDSGILYDQGFFSEYEDKRIKVIKSTETEETRKSKAMAPWCFNQLLKSIETGLVSYLCDDDILYSNAFEICHRWMTNNPTHLAIYTSIDLAFFSYPDEPHVYGQRKALEVGGTGAYRMDGRVDSLQLCHRIEVLKHMDDWWPEGLETADHADGVFMDQIGKICYLYPVPVKTGCNRRTPISTYYK